MEYFDKLFSNKRNQKFSYYQSFSTDRRRSSKTNTEQVRLLLFKECDWRGRKLLFDSSTIERVPSGKNDRVAIKQSTDAPFIVEMSNGYSYVYKGPEADASALGEMIFGAVAMNHKGVSMKIHIMDEPKRLMLTKLFNMPMSRRITRAPPTDDVTSSGTDEVALSFSFDRGDSGFYGEHSVHSSVSSTYEYFTLFDNWDGNGSQDDLYVFNSPPGRKLSDTSTGSWQRRTFRNMATKFDLGSQSSQFLSVPSGVTSNDSQTHSSSTSGTNESLSSAGSASQKKNKLGLALLITVDDNDHMSVIERCVQHAPHMSTLVSRLLMATVAAGGGSSFVAGLWAATDHATRWLSNLLYGPRLQPMWLNLATTDKPSKVADMILSDICSVLAFGDTKHTNFFISTLITHVLTYHLGWVTTVSPYDVLDPQNQDEEIKRPYNALWAQLSDLYGNIGFPPRAARTIISGQNNIQFIKKLLNVLTYFIRCGEVKRKNFEYKETDVNNIKVVNIKEKSLNKTPTLHKLVDKDLKIPSVNTLSSSSDTLKSVNSVKRTPTLGNLNMLSNCDEPMTSQLRRTPSKISLKDSSVSSSDDEVQNKVVFVLGDDEKLIGLKNKSVDGRSVKKSIKHNEVKDSKEVREESPSKCCGQTLQHSKPIKHSGFKFDFDKYPQIVTNYMKSKNLEILDRHYLGKPGNLKLDNFQFDPNVVLPIQEEKCEICYKCQLLESTLQTPTNASELEFMNDMPRQVEPQYEKAKITEETDELSTKTFIRKTAKNTFLVNVTSPEEKNEKEKNVKVKVKESVAFKESDKEKLKVRQVIEFPFLPLDVKGQVRSGFDASLLGGVTDYYVPDLVLQGTLAKPCTWEAELKRDLDLNSYLNKSMEAPIQAVAIVGDINSWEVRVRGGGAAAAGGVSTLVTTTLDGVVYMRRAGVPAGQCLSFMEAKLREFCVLSKTLADMLMTTDFCDIATLTKSLNIDINDVPLLLAVATTHTPQVAKRYGISYR